MKYLKERQINELKDKAVLFAWVAGLLLLISILMIFTAPLQSHYIMRSVNNVFINNNDTRRLTASIQKKSDKANLLGYWYSMFNTSDNMFVFAVFQDGILVPLGAIVSTEEKVIEILPLSAHAAQVFDSLPKSILQMYVTRIESTNIEGNR